MSKNSLSESDICDRLIKPVEVHALKGFLNERLSGDVTELTFDGIRSVLRNLNAPKVHV